MSDEANDIVRRVVGAEILRLPTRSNGAPPSGPIGDGDHGGGEPPGGNPPDDDDDDGDGVDGIIDRLNEHYALVLVGQRALVIEESDDVPIEDRVRMISVEAFRVFFANRSSRVMKWTKQDDGTFTKAKRLVKWAPTWLSHQDRRTYRGIEFFPSPDGSGGTSGYFNLWRGFSVRPDSASAEARRLKYKTFRDHLLTNVCTGSPELFQWIFAWFAHIVQFPRERIGTAIVLRGKMGTGKTKVGEYIGALFASHYFLVDDPRYLVGQFNAHMASCLLLQVDEGFWAGDKAAEGRLKGLVTAPKQMIEAKGVDPIRLDNYVRLLFSSNEDWVVPAGMDERRFAVLDVAPNVAQNHAYFGEMDSEMRAGGLEALLADLLAYDLAAPDAPNIRVIPKTDALLEQKLRSLDPVTSWWFERLHDGAPTRRRGSWAEIVPIDLLFDDYVHTAEKVGVRRKSEKTSFGIRLHKLVPGMIRERRFVDMDNPDGSQSMRRVWCLRLPSLAACRQAFETALGGQAVPWGSDEDLPSDREEEPMREGDV